MKGKHEKKKKMKTLTAILLAVGLFVVAFIIAMIVIFCIKGSTPDVLIQYTLGAGGVEAVACAAIQIVNNIKDKKAEGEE